MSKWDNYHEVSTLSIEALQGSILKKKLLEYRKRQGLFNKTADRLLGIPHLPKDGIRVLDIGCGSGYTLMILKDIYPNMEAYGTDIVKTLDLPEFVLFYPIDLETDMLPFNEDFFDFVICHGVIEHIRNVTGLFSEAYRVLKKGGIFHLLTENYTTVFLPSVFINKHGVNFWDDYTHLRPYTKKSLKRLFHLAGFGECKITTPRNIFIILAAPLLLVLQLAGKVNIGKLLFEIFAPDLFGEAHK